tara:strand:+ start:3205 stop:3942 length:738 start_codon:yes stop_codon:yes gene_type:complete
MPKQAAHQKLYKMFNDSRLNFDYLAKLDADMAFSKPDSLAEVLKEFGEGVDMVSATVHDGITNTDMQSFNVFSARCYFHFSSNDPLFTDQLGIDFPGVQHSYVDRSRNILHAFNPSPFQAFMFGVHRALKVVQPGAKTPKLNDAYHQRYILNKAYNHYIETKSEHSKYALWGATLVFQNVIDSLVLFQKDDYIPFFDNVISKGGVDIDPRLSENGLFSLIKLLGVRKFFSSALAQLAKRLRSHQR